MSALKPCPFCGCESIQVVPDDDGWVVQCMRPPEVCPMRVTVVYSVSEEAAVAAWNKRADAAIRLEMLREVRERAGKYPVLMQQNSEEFYNYTNLNKLFDRLIAEEEEKS